MDDRNNLVSQTLWARGGKRFFDIIFTIILLIILSPILLLSAILVKLTSAGPLFFIQERIGKDGRPFRMVKFRTMRSERKPDPKELVPLNHPEITPVGWYLRRFKIDEAPQLLSVLAGTMSLVGPRPTLPDQVAAYDDFRRLRLLVRPGITGLAQVNGNTSVSWDERILYDIAYVRCCDFAVDMSILLNTVRVIWGGEGRAAQSFVNSIFTKYVTPPDGYFRR